ncbi:MAG: haloacid dehalogenase-like hydrolase [Clostridia bacterium]
MEMITKGLKTHRIHSVIFDFDGTLSLIRRGWQEIMTPYFTEVLMDTPGTHGFQQENECARDFIDLLTGKQTIYQCIRLNEEVVKRGGEKRDPMVYKDEYNRRLLEKIEYRRKGLLEKTIETRDYLVPGSVGLLESLLAHGMDIYLASGTDHLYVEEEARLLDLAKYFGDRIYGARDDYKLFSKAMVIRRILEENNIRGDSLAGFGDGYVEIENVKEVGGLAFGVASDEEKMEGVDLWKRDRLIRAGADVIIPDFRNLHEIEALLYGG